MANTEVCKSEVRRTEVLLTSEQFVKTVTNISDNLSGKLILPAIREAQFFGLKNIIGNKLYSSLLSAVGDGTIYDDDKVELKELLDISQYYLAYSAVANVVILTAVKIDNIGVVNVNDDKSSNIGLNDSFSIRDFYQKKADYYASQIQKCLKGMKGFIDSCNTNTYSAATSSIWLGGYRGAHSANKKIVY